MEARTLGKKMRTFQRSHLRKGSLSSLRSTRIKKSRLLKKRSLRRSLPLELAEEACLETTISEALVIRIIWLISGIRRIRKQRKRSRLLKFPYLMFSSAIKIRVNLRFADKSCAKRK